ncbi:MAG: M1 family metallopeptidase [Candidatus Krumholzibacteriia bacterium]
MRPCPFLVLLCLLPAMHGSARATLPTPGPDAAAIEGNGRSATWAAAAAKRLPLADPRQDTFDVLDYDNQIALDFAAQTLWGWTAVTFHGAPGDTARQLVLDFLEPMDVLAVRAADTSPLPYTRADGRLVIDLALPLTATDTTTVDIFFHGTPAPDGFLGFAFDTTPDGAPLASTLSEPWSARSWWPCRDDPRDKATCTARLYVPTGLTAVSNGVRLAAAKNAGLWDTLVPAAKDAALYVPFFWRESLPISTYHVSLAVSNYVELHDVWQDLPIVHYVYPSQVAAARVDFAAVPDMLAFCSDRFGPYPFAGQKYGMASFNWDGAMEHPTATSWGTVLMTGDARYETVVLHELSHQWFGDQATCADWTQTWLNEGFATYAEALWAEYRNGPTARKWFMVARSVFEAWSGPLVREPGHTDPAYYFDDMVYYKGAWVLHMLRRRLGDPLFYACLRAWLEEPGVRFGTGTSDDFVRVCERVSGQDLGWFFPQWLYWTVYPLLDVGWVNSAPGALTVTVRQSQPPDPVYGDRAFAIPIELGLAGVGFVDTVSVFMDRREQTFTLPTPGAVTSLTVDPGRWLLQRTGQVTQATTTGATGPSTAARLLPTSPNPMAGGGRIRWETAVSGADALAIHDLRGRRLLARRWEERPAGPHEFVWDGRDDAGRRCPAGVYLVTITCAPAADATPAAGAAGADRAAAPTEPVRLRGRLTLTR